MGGSRKWIVGKKLRWHDPQPAGSLDDLEQQWQPMLRGTARQFGPNGPGQLRMPALRLLEFHERKTGKTEVVWPKSRLILSAHLFTLRDSNVNGLAASFPVKFVSCESRPFVEGHRPRAQARSRGGRSAGVAGASDFGVRGVWSGAGCFAGGAIGLSGSATLRASRAASTTDGLSGKISSSSRRRCWVTGRLHFDPSEFDSGARVEERASMPSGTIKKLVHDKGFGFIATSDGSDVFFHHSSAVDRSVRQPGKKVSKWNTPSNRDPVLARGPRAASVTPS